MGKYDINQASPELYQKFLEKFAQNESVKQIQREIEDAKRHLKLATAITLENKLQRKRELAYDYYMESIEGEGRRIDVKKSGLPQEAIEMMHILYTTAFMACDIIDWTVIDMNDLLKKHDPSMSFETFNDLKRMVKVAREKIEMFKKDSGFTDTPIWRERVDDMYEMMKNKARRVYLKNTEEETKK